MKLISKIEIHNFRSIGNSVLEDISDFSILAGMNNSGKSNFLRALSAFFKDEVEEGKSLNVDLDYYRPALRSRKKKSISIKIYFELPDAFNFRSELKDVEEFLGGSSFAITKRWTRANPFPEIYLNDDDTPVSLIDRQKIEQFLGLISFRYIPNRVLPLEVILSEHKALRDVLVRRLGRAAPSDAVFKNIANTSNKLIEKVSDDVARIGTGIDSVRLDTPSSWAEMLFSFGYKIKEDEFELDDSVQGSGIQSLLMFETLHLIDRDYFQKFGWRQAAIWAIEEPESSMHTSLEVQTANLLTSIANEPYGRLQIIGTSHSELMIQYADSGFLISRSSKGSNAERLTPRELLTKASELGVSRFSHPLLFHPHIPIVLVEGKFDKTYLERVLKLLGRDDEIEISILETLTEGHRTGGRRDLLKYIKDNRNAIRCRAINAPVTVILDWEDQNKLPEFQKIPSYDGRYRVTIWPLEAANPALDGSFKGIERFYPTRIIEKGRSDGLHIGQELDGSYMVSSSYGDIKRHLSTIIRKDLQFDDIQNIKDFIIREVLP